MMGEMLVEWKNYRTISLLKAFCKPYCTILNEKLKAQADNFPL